MRNNRGLSPAISAVESLLKSQELAQALRPHMAKSLWAEVVGPQVASVTQVERVQGGDVLVVRVKNGVWANELTLLKDDMLRRLNRALGGRVLTDIHFKASGLTRVKKAATVREEPVPYADDLALIPLPEDTRSRINAAVRAIPDDLLRDKIRRGLTHAARLDSWKEDHGWLPCMRCSTLTAPSTIPPLCPLCSVVSR